MTGADAGSRADAGSGAVAVAPRRDRGRVVVAVAAAVAVVLAAVVGFSLGRLSTIGAVPGDTSAEAGFARDMQTHHLQGVEMAMIVRDATADPEVRLLAYDIATTQAQQAGQLYGWLGEWGLSQAGSEPPMTWMTRAADGAGHTGHEGAAHEPGAPMPGLATPAELDELRSLSGVAAERRFLELMIAHHLGAVAMAEAYLDRGERATVRQFAANVVRSQEAEIGLMERLLAERS